MRGRCLISACLCLATAAQADGVNPHLAHAKAHYAELDFERCLRRASQGAQVPGSEVEKAELLMYRGLCSMGLGNTRAARKDFEQAFRLNPNLELPLLQSPRVVSLFASARPVRSPDTPVVAVTTPPAADVPAMAENPAPSLTPGRDEVPAGPEAAPVATPPAVFKVSTPRPSAVPIVLGASAVALLATALILGLAAKSAEQAALSAHFEVVSYAFAAQSRGLALGSNLSYGLCGALTISSVLAFIFIRPDAPTLNREVTP